MTVFTYSRVPAFNPNTTPVSVARSATGNVYDIGDTGFTTPLNLTLVATNTVTTTLVSDSFGMFPDFNLVDRTQCVFKSGSFKMVLTTTTPIPGPTGAASTVPGPPGPPTTDASQLTAGTVADARLPQRLQDDQLAATYATVLGNSNGSDDTPKIQAALTAARLAGGGLVLGKQGETYRVAGELLIGSDTVFDLSGSKIIKPNGNNNRVIKNYADTQTAATGTASTTSGSNIITTALASQAVIGQTLHVLDAGGNGGGPLVGVVESVNTGAGTITVATLDGRPEKATATVAGKTAKLFNRDRNITIKIGVMDTGTNILPFGTTFGNVYVRHIDGVRIHIGRYQNTVTGRGVGFGDCTNLHLRVDEIQTEGVGVQCSGPANDVNIEYISGSAGDDLVAFTAGDYPDMQATAGDITNVTIGTVLARDSHLNIFKVLSGAGRKIDKLKVTGGITGTGRGQGVCMGDDTYMPQTTGGTYGDIDLGTVDLQTTSYAVALNGPAIDTLRARIIFDPSSPTHVGTPISIAGSSTATIKNLILTGTIRGRTEGIVTINSAAMTIDRIIFDSMHIEPNSLSTIFKAVTTTAAATVGDVVFRDVTAKFIGQTQYMVYNTSGTVKQIHFNGGTYTNGNCPVYLQQVAATKIWLIGATMTGAGRFANLLCPATVQLHNPSISTSNAAIYLSGAALTLTGMCLDAFLVQKAASESVRINGTTLKADIATLTPGDGDMVFNTNGAAAGGGTAVFSAGIGKWKGLYSGTTYP